MHILLGYVFEKSIQYNRDGQAQSNGGGPKEVKSARAIFNRLKKGFLFVHDLLEK